MAEAESKPAPALQVRGLRALYGDSIALDGIDFEARRGETIALLGRNGAGKSTTLKCLIGLHASRSGSVLVDGAETISAPPEAIARLGLAYCPEERGVFASLSVEENLLLPPVLAPGGLTLEEIYELFPNLAERRSNQGTKLSGGEQQMLAIGRILRTGARTLLLDEPTEGLAPVIVERIEAVVRHIKERGLTLILVEQNFRFAAGVADRFYVLETGRIARSFAVGELDENRSYLEQALSI